MIIDESLGLDVAPDQWDISAFRNKIFYQFSLDLESTGIDPDQLERHEIEEKVWEAIRRHYHEKETSVGSEAMRYYERIIRLNIVDVQWKDHLQAIDHLKEWINQMGYAQKDPLVEYKKQSFELFEQMLDRIDIETVRALYHLQLSVEQPPEERLQRRPRRGQMTFTKANATAARAGEEEGRPKTVVKSEPKIGRNDACFCGSGKKYKKCHGIDG